MTNLRKASSLRNSRHGHQKYRHIEKRNREKRNERHRRQWQKRRKLNSAQQWHARRIIVLPHLVSVRRPERADVRASLAATAAELQLKLAVTFGAARRCRSGCLILSRIYSCGTPASAVRRPPGRRRRTVAKQAIIASKCLQSSSSLWRWRASPNINNGVTSFGMCELYRPSSSGDKNGLLLTGEA